MDEERRRRERAARLDPTARGHLLIDRVRAGELRQDAVELAAYMGREDACLATGVVPKPRGTPIYDVFYRQAMPGKNQFSLLVHMTDEVVRLTGTRAFDILASFGANVCAMWAFDTALRAIERQSDDQAVARDKLLLSSLLTWILDDDPSNRNVVEASSRMVLEDDPELDVGLTRVMAHALQTGLETAPPRIAREAIAACSEASDMPLAGCPLDQPWPLSESECDRQRAALAKIVLLEDQPFDESGKPRPIPYEAGE